MLLQALLFRRLKKTETLGKVRLVPAPFEQAAQKKRRQKYSCEWAQKPVNQQRTTAAVVFFRRESHHVSDAKFGFEGRACFQCLLAA
jgi:hypothetical protein